MQKDAKFGLVVGVGLVILIAVTFYRRESPSTTEGAPASVTAAGPSPTAPPRGQYRPVRAKPTQRPEAPNPNDQQPSKAPESLAAE